MTLFYSHILLIYNLGYLIQYLKNLKLIQYLLIHFNWEESSFLSEVTFHTKYSIFSSSRTNTNPLHTCVYPVIDSATSEKLRRIYYYISAQGSRANKSCSNSPQLDLRTDDQLRSSAHRHNRAWIASRAPESNGGAAWSKGVCPSTSCTFGSAPHWLPITGSHVTGSCKHWTYSRKCSSLSGLDGVRFPPKG